MNLPDITRYAHDPRSTTLAQAVGLPVCLTMSKSRISAWYPFFGFDTNNPAIRLQFTQQLEGSIAILLLELIADGGRFQQRTYSGVGHLPSSLVPTRLTGIDFSHPSRFHPGRLRTNLLEPARDGRDLG